MYTKTWNAHYKELSIEVTNSWNWQGDTEEQVIINGEVVQRRSFKFDDVKFSRALATVFTIEYEGNEVKVICGSAWHLFGTACRIEVNGEFAGGNRIVLFAKKQS